MKLTPRFWKTYGALFLFQFVYWVISLIFSGIGSGNVVLGFPLPFYNRDCAETCELSMSLSSFLIDVAVAVIVLWGCNLIALKRAQRIQDAREEQQLGGV